MLIFYLIMALLVFLLQSLLPLALLAHLDLLTLFIVFVSLREKFIIAVSLSLISASRLIATGWRLWACRPACYFWEWWGGTAAA